MTDVTIKVYPEEKNLECFVSMFNGYAIAFITNDKL